MTTTQTPPAPPAAPAKTPFWALVSAAVAALAIALLALSSLGGASLPGRNGPPVEELSVERTVLRPGTVELTVRNTGPDPVQVAQVFVNDSYVDVTGGASPLARLGTATLNLSFPWQEGQPLLISMLTSTGLVIEHEVAAAVATPDNGAAGLMATIGLYVGVLPVAFGMLMLPVLRRAGSTAIQVLLAVTVGLLAFLAVDGTLDALDLGSRSGGAFGGPSLVVLGAGLAFLGLMAVDGFLRNRRKETGGLRLAVTIAAAIGLHNLGEGLAIGSAYAVGELALGAFLVVGFAAHNVTEGMAIVVPLTRRRTTPLQLAGLAVLAGAPAIVGAVVGARVSNPELSAFLIGVGVGAIAQVIVQIAPSLRSRAGERLSPSVIGGIGAGALVMYLTGLLVTV